MTPDEYARTLPKRKRDIIERALRFEGPCRWGSEDVSDALCAAQFTEAEVTKVLSILFPGAVAR